MRSIRNLLKPVPILVVLIVSVVGKLYAENRGEEPFKGITYGPAENLLKEIQEKGADVFFKELYNDQKYSLLHIAVESMNTAAVEHLLNEARADANVKDNRGMTPLHVLGIRRNTFLTILQEDHDRTYTRKEPFDFEKLQRANRQLIDIGLSIENVSTALNQLLGIKRREGSGSPNNGYWYDYTKIANLLLENGARLDVQNSMDDTPLDIVSEDETALLYLLIGTDIKINSSDLPDSNKLHSWLDEFTSDAASGNFNRIVEIVYRYEGVVVPKYLKENLQLITQHLTQSSKFCKDSRKGMCKLKETSSSRIGSRFECGAGGDEYKKTSRIDRWVSRLQVDIGDFFHVDINIRRRYLDRRKLRRIIGDTMREACSANESDTYCHRIDVPRLTTDKGVVASHHWGLKCSDGRIYQVVP